MKTYQLAWLQDSWRCWLTWLLLAGIFATVCVFLSQWQFNRRTEALVKIDRVVQNFDQPALPIEQLVPRDKFDSENEWRQVTLSGHFLIEDAVLVRNRPNNGQPGFLQLIPFISDAGKIYAIETGWIPTGEKQDYPDAVAMPSAADRQIIARIRAAEPSLNRNAPSGQIATINIESLIAKTQVSNSIYKRVYFSLAQKYNNQRLPILTSRPQMNEGNHLSYALQWILFALMAFAALWWAIKQELRARQIALDPNFVPKKRFKVGDLDKAIEDSATS